MTYINSAPLTLAAIEKLTGLSREVLRKWELRYHFPKPLRGRRGERLFTAADAARLQLQAYLIASGLRAGRVVPLEMAQLQDLLATRPPASLPVPDPAQMSQQRQSLLLRLTPTADAGALQAWLTEAIEQAGLAQFVAHVMPVFNEAVGTAWQTGQLSIHAEHHYTETLRQVVTHALPLPRRITVLPRVLLTSPPGELHGLGLLALQAQLRLVGANVVSLGTQTPAACVLDAQRSHGAGVVAISISVCLDSGQASTYVRALKAGLPADCALWLGGSGCAALPVAVLSGCEVFGDTHSAVLRWQQLADAPVSAP